MQRNVFGKSAVRVYRLYAIVKCEWEFLSLTICEFISNKFLFYLFNFTHIHVVCKETIKLFSKECQNNDKHYNVYCGDLLCFLQDSSVFPHGHV